MKREEVGRIVDEKLINRIEISLSFKIKITIIISILKLQRDDLYIYSTLKKHFFVQIRQSSP